VGAPKAVVVAAMLGRLVPRAVRAVVLLPAAVLHVAGGFGRRHGALDPRHVRELASVLREGESRSGASLPAPLATWFGVRVAHGSEHDGELSGAEPVTERARARASVVALARRRGQGRRRPGGLLHVVIPRALLVEETARPRARAGRD
jgi:hypothetical protein